MSIINRIYAALDGMDRASIDQFIAQPGNEFNLKIGLELYLKYGRDIVLDLHGKTGRDIFLDLKLHDIPVTVAKAISSLEGLPIKFLTIHLSGGQKMIEEALLSASRSLPNTTLLGVSYLTSLSQDDLHSLWKVDDMSAAFERMFTVGIEAGIKGMVLSAQELEILKRVQKQHGTEIVSMCPGIRFSDEIANGATGDQKRVLSPAEAIASGASWLVMGRSLTKALDFSARVKELQNISST